MHHNCFYRNRNEISTFPLYQTSVRLFSSALELRCGLSQESIMEVLFPSDDTCAAGVVYSKPLLEC